MRGFLKVIIWGSMPFLDFSKKNTNFGLWGGQNVVTYQCYQLWKQMLTFCFFSSQLLFIRAKKSILERLKLSTCLKGGRSKNTAEFLSLWEWKCIALFSVYPIFTVTSLVMFSNLFPKILKIKYAVEMWARQLFQVQNFISIRNF